MSLDDLAVIGQYLEVIILRWIVSTRPYTIHVICNPVATQKTAQ